MSRPRLIQNLAALEPTDIVIAQPQDDDNHDTPPPASTYSAVKLPAHKNTNKHKIKDNSKDEGGDHKPSRSDKSANLKSNDVAAAAVPAPVPDTGLVHTALQNFASQPPPQPSVSQSIPPTTLASFPPASPATTPAVIPSLLLTSAAPSPTVQSQNTASITANQPGSSPLSKSFSPAIIALIAVGGAMLILALFLCARILRPRRKIRPTPSLPILDREGSDYDVEKESVKRRGQLAPDESPLFGGTERFSRAESGGPVKWTQYQSGIPEKLNTSSSQVHAVSFALDATGPEHGQFASPPSPAAAEIKFATAATYAHPVTVAPPQTLSTPYSHSRTHANVDALRGKYMSRLSTLTLAPEPPAELAAAGAIGVAVSGEDLSLSTYGDDEAVVVRPPPAARRLSRSASASRRRSRMQDMRRSTYRPDEEGLAYAAPDAEPETEPSGRARIKAPYDVRSYIRTSYATTTAPGARASVYAAHESRVPIPSIPVPPISSAPGRNGALAHVLGLDRKDAHMTLYPDDSLSRQASLAVPSSRGRKPVMVEEKREMSRDSALLASPSTALGRLMLDPASPQPELHHAYAGVADRPPRVPSPPALPSLAQMALENQEGFDEYRSPTYSIYGLYEADRKSRTSRAVW